MAATTILGSKPVKGAGDNPSEVRLTILISVEMAVNDSKPPPASRPQAVSSESRSL
jgi:hypothetical protein